MHTAVGELPNILPYSINLSKLSNAYVLLINKAMTKEHSLNAILKVTGSNTCRFPGECDFRLIRKTYNEKELAFGDNAKDADSLTYTLSNDGHCPSLPLPFSFLFFSFFCGNAKPTTSHFCVSRAGMEKLFQLRAAFPTGQLSRGHRPEMGSRPQARGGLFHPSR